VVELQKLSLQANVFTYSSAASACEHCGQCEAVLGLIDEMLSRGLRPDAIVYSSAIRTVVKGLAFETALELILQMQALALVPTVDRCSAIVSHSAVSFSR
jgi:leucine-rich PPR motif-containing protein